MLGRRLLPPIAVGLMSLLSACAGTPKIDPDVDAYGMPNAELALQRSIDRVDAAMLNLGGMSGPAGSRPQRGRSSRPSCSAP